jgi:tetratricopeptide (TPR) repeat protein
MATSLLQAPTNATPEVTLNLKEHAPEFFKSQRNWGLPWPLNLLLNSESQEKWQIYENILLACLRTGDNESAYLCLEELTDRFGVENDRVLALRALYKEATANTQQELATVMQQYQDMLKEDPSVISIRKRRAALLRSTGKIPEAVTALTNLVDTLPTDPEVWSELSDVYLSQGAFEQAIYSLEEVLLISPYAWNVHAKLGEVLYLSADRLEGEAQRKALAESMRRFCRSLELCDDYLRGFYGLKLVSIFAHNISLHPDVLLTVCTRRQVAYCRALSQLLADHLHLRPLQFRS